jgi:cellobiose phosphorylase
MIAGKDAPNHGEAKNSWLTGTASWNYVAIVQWILGIRSTYEGLQVAPVIPNGWSGFTAIRVFRGVTYRIIAERKGKGNEVRITVNGRPQQGDIVPLPAEETKEVTVRVTLR